MNTIQRRILIAVALVIGAMLLFPPFLCQTTGIGYSFILSTTGNCWGNPGAINATQLAVQWLGVASIGAIAFSLAKDYRPSGRTIRDATAGVFAAIGQARQRAMIWFWLGLSGFAVRMLYVLSNDNSANIISAFGIAGAGLLFFATSTIWHTTRILYFGSEASLPKPGKPVNWARILILSLVAIAILGGFFAWNEAQSSKPWLNDPVIKPSAGKFTPDVTQ